MSLVVGSIPLVNFALNKKKKDKSVAAACLVTLKALSTVLSFCPGLPLKSEKCNLSFLFQNVILINVVVIS